MTDKYRVYRPLLNLIGFTEGTDKGDGYNETLGYGIEPAAAGKAGRRSAGFKARSPSPSWRFPPPPGRSSPRACRPRA